MRGFAIVFGLCLLILYLWLILVRMPEPLPRLIYSRFNYQDGVELFRIRADGKQNRRLTDNDLTERHLTYDGQRVYFAHNDLNNYRIYRLNVGSGRMDLVYSSEGYLLSLIWGYGVLQVQVTNQTGNLVYHLHPFGELIKPQASFSAVSSTDWRIELERLTNNEVAMFAVHDKSRYLLQTDLPNDTMYVWQPVESYPYHGVWSFLSGAGLIVGSFWIKQRK